MKCTTKGCKNRAYLHTNMVFYDYCEECIEKKTTNGTS